MIRDLFLHPLVFLSHRLCIKEPFAVTLVEDTSRLPSGVTVIETCGCSSTQIAADKIMDHHTFRCPCCHKRLVWYLLFNDCNVKIEILDKNGDKKTCRFATPLFETVQLKIIASEIIASISDMKIVVH